MVPRAVAFRLHCWALVGLLFVASGAAADAELDLSPRLKPYELEGIKLSQLAFANGTSKEATYEPPANWKYSGGRDYLDLLPQNLAQAKARITKWPTPPALVFDPESCKDLQQKIVAMLPEGSEQVKIQSEEINPLEIDGSKTYLVELSYVFYGEKYASYSLLLARQPEPLCFRLTCREADYEKLREVFRRSLYSWQNL